MSLRKINKSMIDDELVHEVDELLEKLKYIEDTSPRKVSVLENCSRFSNFFLVYGTSFSLDTINVKTGYQSIKITDSAGSTAIRNNNVLYDFEQTEHFKIVLFVDYVSNLSSIDLFLSNESTYTDYFGLSIDSSQLSNGWNILHILKSDFYIAEGNPLWMDEITSLQIKVSASTSNTVNVTLDSINVDEEQKANVIFLLDDGHVSQYTQAFPILRSKGFRGNIGVISSAIGQEGYLNEEDLRELYSYGWDLANHSDTHRDLSTLSKEEQIDELSACRDYLNGNGYTRASDIVFYPYGGFNEDTIDIINTDYKMGRTINENIENTPPVAMHAIKIVNMLSFRAPSTLNDFVDRAIKVGGTVIFLAHKLTLTANDSVEYPIDSFKQVVDYVYQRKDEVNVLTISEWADLIQ